uniref:Uncharacterized protein n=1 Tax=Rhodosorus marinus TaxID=101924 RepID=A0A7S3A391_9RHOD
MIVFSLLKQKLDLLSLQKKQLLLVGNPPSGMHLPISLTLPQYLSTFSGMLFFPKRVLCLLLLRSTSHAIFIAFIARILAGLFIPGFGSGAGSSMALWSGPDGDEALRALGTDTP